MSNKPTGIGAHTRPNSGEYDTWLTPRPILSVLGKFNLDPCAAPDPRPWDTADIHITWPEDGLLATWPREMRTWLNPPYGRDIGRWMEKMAKHGNGIALTFARTETDAWSRWVWPYATAVLFISGRLHFCVPDGTSTKMNAGGPSALIAYSDADAEILKRCGITGAMVRVVTR